MSFKGTEHYRGKVEERTHVLNSSGDVVTRLGAHQISAREYREDVLTLCDKVEEFGRESEVAWRELPHLSNKIDQLEEVLEAAHALVSAMTGDKRYRDDFKEVLCLDALRDSLNALEQKA